MRVGSDEEPEPKSYIDESSLKDEIDSTLVPSFEETMVVEVQAQKKGHTGV